MRESEHDAAVRAAASRIAGATALVVSAGAGMGVDSGLPDFRGPEGFWRAYPPYATLRLDFADLASPHWFARDPALAWGFYGHRLGLYRRTTPHAGFAVLRRWAAAMPHGAWVYTSNVDGQFQRAGFDRERVVECHGAIDWLQCTRAGCDAGIFPAEPFEVEVDPATFRARGALPACPRCGALARPNILMFGDGGWASARTGAQRRGLRAWLDALAAREDEVRLVVVECGAGTAVPSVRRFGAQLVEALGATLVRINVREPEVPPGGLHVGLALGAMAALTAMDALVSGRGAG